MPAPNARHLATIAALAIALVSFGSARVSANAIPYPALDGSPPRVGTAPQIEGTALSVPVALYPNLPGWYGWGYSVSAAGDVNGDGYADFVVSTKLASPFGTYAVALYYGSPGGPVSPPGWTLNLFSKPVHVSAAGDVNGDGYDDVVFGSADTSGVGTGTVTVWYGGASGLGGSPNFSHSGDSSLGWSVCTAGDVNGDGYDDVLVGDPLSGCAGVVTLYYGSSTGLSSASSWTEGGASCDYRLGITVAGLGDVNGDGFDDIGLGEDMHAAGLTYPVARVELGSSSGPVFSGSFSQSGSSSGQLAPAGDMNGDGYADYWFADPFFSGPTDDYFEMGTAGVANGGPGGPTGASIGLSVNAPYDHCGIVAFTAGDVNGDGLADGLLLRNGGGTNYFTLWLGRHGGEAAAEQVFYFNDVYELGDITGCAAGDVNGDGFGDVIVGLPESSDFGANAGKILLYYGTPDVPVVSTERVGGQTSAVAGWSLAMGDVNGDGFDDVLVGEPLNDNSGATDNGKVELYLGGEGGISSTPIPVGVGTSNNANAGISVAIGQDINGDGYGDIVVGSHVADQVLVWFGHKDWNLAFSFPDQIINSPQPGSYFGGSVAFAGDVDGDGFADVVIGAPGLETIVGHTHHPQAGAAFLYHGSPTGLTFSGWSESPNQDNGQEGTSVAGAGDVNADGYSDVLVGSGFFDATFTDQGHASLYLGGPSGLSATPARTWLGLGASHFFGQAVAGIGDFNGDGYGDIAIGAFNAGANGTVYVVPGNPSGGESEPKYIYEGTSAGGGFGSSVSTAGDVNGDGYADLLVGEVFADVSGHVDCGRASVFLGGTPPATTPYATFGGVTDYDNLGHSVAGGGDVNGDGFADVVIGEPRRNISFFDEGGFRLALGNWRGGAGTGTGRGRPAHATQPGPPVLPMAIYGQSHSPSAFGLACNASSAGGRDLVALDWRVAQPLGGPGPQGRTAWTPMNAPTAPLGGAALASHTVTGLAANSVYGWKTRVVSRSPWFRYGSWFSPQPNSRGQWDVRTAPGTTDAPIAALPSNVELAPSWPNPTSGTAQVNFNLPREMHARVNVRDVQGRVVRQLADNDLAAGPHALRWMADDANGRPCPAGLYFIEVVAGQERRSTRIALVR